MESGGGVLRGVRVDPPKRFCRTFWGGQLPLAGDQTPWPRQIQPCYPSGVCVIQERTLVVGVPPKMSYHSGQPRWNDRPPAAPLSRSHTARLHRSVSQCPRTCPVVIIIVILFKSVVFFSPAKYTAIQKICPGLYGSPCSFRLWGGKNLVASF